MCKNRAMIRPHRVVVLALDEVVPFELGIAGRIFGAAERAEDGPLYEVITCSLDGGPVSTSDDFSINVSYGAEALAGADTVVIPTVRATGPVYSRGELPDALARALALIRPQTRVVSFCTASFILAAAGMLDGRSATTHWYLADDFRRLFPNVDLDPGVLFVDEGRVLTSAGAAAAVDLCLHLVRRDHGSQVANDAARRCVVPPWRDGGQAQYIQRPIPEPAAATTGATRSWAMERLDRPLTLEDLAGHARMSRRNFTRRFREEVGLSPAQWLTRQRIEHARHLLESSDLTVEQIAVRAGFGTAVSLRQHLRAALGVSPLNYRRTFHMSGVAT